MINSSYLINGSDLIGLQPYEGGQFSELYGINDDVQMVGMLDEPWVGNTEGQTVGVILNVLPAQP
jgi:hypothetical protein